VTDHIVVGDRVLLDASFRAARTRLEILVSDEMLSWASGVAYGEGITGLVEVAGPAAGQTRLARGPPGRPSGNPRPAPMFCSIGGACKNHAMNTASVSTLLNTAGGTG
jgi:hypothetical protein